MVVSSCIHFKHVRDINRSDDLRSGLADARQLELSTFDRSAQIRAMFRKKKDMVHPKNKPSIIQSSLGIQLKVQHQVFIPKTKFKNLEG